MAKLAVIILLLLIGGALDAAFNNGQWQVGYEQAKHEEIARKSERDKVLRDVGLCKWAKIMADEIKCKAELP